MDAATNMLNTRISYRTVTKVTLPTFSTARAIARLWLEIRRLAAAVMAGDRAKRKSGRAGWNIIKQTRAGSSSHRLDFSLVPLFSTDDWYILKMAVSGFVPYCFL